jgi:hypothetical protein
MVRLPFSRADADDIAFISWPLQAARISREKNKKILTFSSGSSE